MDDKEIRKLAKLARIQIEDDEIPAIANDLARVVGYVSEIKNAGIETSALREEEALRNVMRDDGIPHETGAYTDDILRNVPVREGDYVSVKKIL